MEKREMEKEEMEAREMEETATALLILASQPPRSVLEARERKKIEEARKMEDTRNNFSCLLYARSQSSLREHSVLKAGEKVDTMEQKAAMSLFMLRQDYRLEARKREKIEEAREREDEAALSRFKSNVDKAKEKAGERKKATEKKAIEKARERKKATEKKDDSLCLRWGKRKRRSWTIILASSTATMSKEDPKDHIHGVPIMESPTNPTRKRPLSPPIEKEPKKANRNTGPCLAAGASSSGSREEPPEWLLRLMRSKNGSEPKNIIEKELTATDVNSVNARLSMPSSNIVDMEFLSPEEERIIEEDATRKRQIGVSAKLVVSDLREFPVTLRRWDMKKKSGSHNYIYNLATKWNDVVKNCGLKEKDVIRVWSFHANGQLYFAFVPPPPSSS